MENSYNINDNNNNREPRSSKEQIRNEQKNLKVLSYKIVKDCQIIFI